MSHSLPDGTNPILIVDDAASEAAALEHLCRSLGVRTMRVAGAAEAGEVLAAMRPAAIITDLEMSHRKGLGCLDLIAEHLPTVPVMVVAPSEWLLHKAANELGGSYGLSDLTCVVKPVGLPALTAFMAHSGVRIRTASPSVH